MTIYTGKLLEKDEKKVYPAPEVVVGHPPNPETENLANERTVYPAPLVVSVSSRRRSACATACLVTTALIVVAVAVLGGVYLYRSLARKTFSGWCAVPYYEEQEMQLGDYSPRHSRLQRKYGSFQEHLEVGEGFESIDVPEFEISASATVMHDFEKNLTTIVDKLRRHCFLMPLNRSVIVPPRDYWDLLTKILEGSYMPNLAVLRERYAVVKPRLDSLVPYGYYVWAACSGYDTFRLQRLQPTGPRAIAKRSAGEIVDYAVPGGNSQLLVIEIENP